MTGNRKLLHPNHNQAIKSLKHFLFKCNKLNKEKNHNRYIKYK